LFWNIHVAYLLPIFATTLLVVLHVWRTMLEWFLIAIEEGTDLKTADVPAGAEDVMWAALSCGKVLCGRVADRK
jgi:hypothetical protein